MKRFYVVFKDGKVYAVMATYFALIVIYPMDLSSVSKAVQTYTFYDEMSKIVGQFYYDDILCITNEKPE